MAKTTEASSCCSLFLEINNRITSLTETALVLSAFDERLSRTIKAFDLKTAKSEADALLQTFQKISTDVNEVPKAPWSEVQVGKILNLCLMFSTELAILSKISKVWKILEDINHRLGINLPEATNRFAEYFGLHEGRTTCDHITSNFDNVNLLSVSNLLEVRCIVPQWLENHTEYFLNDILALNLKCASKGNVLNDAFLTVKLLMQVCQLHPEKVLLWTQKKQENEVDICMDHILIGLIRMICGKHFSSDTCHMSSLALVHLLKVVSTDSSTLQENIKKMLDYLLKTSPSAPDDSSWILIGGQNVLIKPLTYLSQSECAFGSSCFGRATLKGLSGTMLISSTESNSCLLETLLDVICTLEERKQGSEYQYVLFISAWYETCLQHSNNPAWQQTDKLWAKMESVMQVMWCEINTPLAGLQEQLMRAFQAFIKILYIKTKKENSKALQLYQQLTWKVLAAPFHIKARYLILGSIIQSFGASSVISVYPVIPGELVRCMHTNHLRSVAEVVYKHCMKDLRNKINQGDIDEGTVLEEWKQLWSHVILQGLCSNDSLTRSHVCNYFVSHTLKALPGCVKLLVASLNSLEGIQEARKLHATIMILKQAKMKGILTDNSLMQYESMLTAGLHHLDDCIRSDSFGLLVQSSQTCQPFPASTLKLLKEFIFDNLNSDNTAFRNNFVTDVKTALHRMRDSSSPLIREISPNDKRDGQYVNENQVIGKLLAMATTVDEIFEKCLWSLFPGASYQRKRTCLDILNSLYQCFLRTADGRTQKKGISEESKKIILTWMQENGKCHLLSPRSACLLLSCLLESSNDLQCSAFSLLTTHFPWPLPYSDTSPWAEPTEILCLGLKLICSPRVHDSEAGSLLCKMAFMKNVIEKKTHMRNIYPEKTFAEPVRNKPKKKKDKESAPLYPPKHKSPGFHFLRSLLDSLKFQFTAMQKNTLIAAALTPMYGLVMALSQCLTKVPGYLEKLARENEDDAKTFLSELVETLQSICKFILKLLSGRAFKMEEKSDSLTFSPSFGEMTEAITDVVSSLSQLQVEEDAVEEGTDAATDIQLILSCSWLSLKHCSHLLSQVSAQLIQSRKLQCVLEDATHVAIAMTLMDILILCRHKGVIENCSIALSSLCSAFLASSKPDLEKEVEALLQRTFDLISNESQRSSVTKNSAGLPMLVEAVITAEPKQRERKLLKLSMVRLMAVANEPLPDELSEKEDLPQAHALNIMHSLFRSSITAEDISVYISDVLQITISGFSSTSFAVRNSSMQLFGTLVSRLFGQKKVTDEHSILNTLSVEELFSRYDDMRQYLLTEVVSAANDLGAERRDGCLIIRPGLQPVLVILSKLGRGIQEKYDESISRPFRESLLVLLSSPIYFVRRLIPRALLPFIAQSELDKFIDDLLNSFPQTQDQTISHNRIHGELLLLQELIKQETANDKRIYKIGLKLSQISPWIGQTVNPCAFTKAAYIHILSLVLENVTNVSATDDFVKLCQTVVDAMNKETSYFHIGGPELCNAFTYLAFTISLKELASSVSSREVAVKFLHHSSQDVRLATLTYIASNLTQFSSVGEIELLANAVMHCLLDETSHSNRSEGLNVWASLCSLAGDLTLTWNIPEWQNLHSKFITIATGCEGSLLCASSLLALSSLCQVDSKRCKTGFNWHEWVSLMTCYCQPDQSESLRMAVVKSLRVTADICFAALCQKEEERDAECAVSLLQCIFKLLQDEQSEIRQAIARYVNMFTHNASGSSMECVQVNHIFKKLIIYFCNLFSWSKSVLSLLFEWLSGSPGEPVTAMIEEIKTSHVSLFEQISNNIFTEPVIEVEYLAAGIQALVQRLSQEDPEFLTDWLKSRHHAAVDEIKAVIELMGKLTVADKSFFGVTGFRQPYQAVYKLLRSVILLKSVSESVSNMQPLEVQRQELATSYATIMEMHHIHPLLQDGLLLSGTKA